MGIKFQGLLLLDFLLMSSFWVLLMFLVCKNYGV